MRWFQLGIALLILQLSANEQNITEIAAQAESLWEVQDDKGAENLYEKLLDYPLPDWQRARIIYNLGTIKIAEQEPDEALTWLQKISPQDLSLPRYGRQLFLNQGIAYLQFAQTLVQNTPFRAQFPLYMQASLDTFTRAWTLNCKIQQLEQQDNRCAAMLQIERWSSAALAQLDEMYRELAKDWMAQASVESLATYLSILLQELLSTIKASELHHQKSEGFSYFVHQAQSLTTLWEAIKQHNLTSKDLATFNIAEDGFRGALQALGDKDGSSTIKSLENAFKNLEPLTFKENISLKLARLNLAVLLIQPTLTAGDIQAVQWEVDQVKEADGNGQILEKIKKYLQNSLAAIQMRDPSKTRFYLLAAFGLLDPLLPSNQSAFSSLNETLDGANRLFQLYFAMQLMPPQSMQQEEMRSIVNDQQQEVLTSASFFIPAVLKEQHSNYSERRDPCQQSPWDQVIPLYDRGYLAAKHASQLLATPAPPMDTVEAEWESTIRDWHQAVALLQNPPPPSGKQTAAPNAAPKNLAETFRMIQEMYLEDQSQPMPANQELHSW